MAAGLAERSYMELGPAPRAPPRRLREVSFSPPGTAPVPSGRYGDSAGGFCYRECAQLGAATRNRCVRWTTSGDTLELVEESLDTELLNNAVRLHIQGCPLLPGGVHLCEVQNHLVLLLVTVQSVHRVLLPHPAYAYRGDLITESQMQSVFTDVGKINFRDPSSYYLIPSVPGLAANSVASAAWLSSDGEALFALPSAAGGIFVIKLPPHDVPGVVSVVELKQSSVVQRFLTGWMPTAIRLLSDRQRLCADDPGRGSSFGDCSLMAA